VARSRLGDCGVMRNLPVDPSTVNPKTLVQLKKIRRGKIRSRADQDHFRTRASAAALRGNFRGGDRSCHRIVVQRTAYFPQAAHRKCRKSSRQFLVFDRHSDPHSDRRSAVLKFSRVLVRTTVCRNPELPTPACGLRRSRGCACFPLQFLDGCWNGDENFSETRRVFSNSQGQANWPAPTSLRPS
jgi:hypothetical protein